jgi:hypothetical protein
MSLSSSNPVDDMHGANPPSHPELLDLRSRRFADSGFDLKFVARAIVKKHFVQLTHLCFCCAPTGEHLAFFSVFIRSFCYITSIVLARRIERVLSSDLEVAEASWDFRDITIPR